MTTDPRTSLDDALNHIDTSNLTVEDGSQAKLRVYFDMPEENLKNVFRRDKADLVVTKKLDRIEPINTPSGTRGYRWYVIVTPWTIDKRADASSMKVIGSKLLWKAVDEINRVLRTYVTGSASRMVTGGREEKHRLGGTILYSYPIEVVLEEYV